MSWYWKKIEDKSSAEDALKPAMGASYFVAAVTGVVAILSIVYQKPIYGVNAWSLVDAALFAVIGWRISRRSRAWAIAGLAIYVVENLMTIGSRGPGFGAVTILFILAYINGVRGAFAYHKYAKVETTLPPQSLPASLG